MCVCLCLLCVCVCTVEASDKQKIGFLSADAARAEQSRMFDDLNKKVPLIL